MHKVLVFLISLFFALPIIADNVKSNSLISILRVQAEQGDPKALCDLALCYMEGRGIQKNEHKAVELYRKAANQGDEFAIERLKAFGLM